MYASDNGGRYPTSLAVLLKSKHLQSIPTCASARKDTYSQVYVAIQEPDNFSFYCQGNHHGRSYRGFAGDSSNFPQYNAEVGLIDHP